MTIDLRVIETAIALRNAAFPNAHSWDFAAPDVWSRWVAAAVVALDMADRAVDEALRRQATAPMSRDLPAGEVVVVNPLQWVGRDYKTNTPSRAR